MMRMNIDDDGIDDGRNRSGSGISVGIGSTTAKSDIYETYEGRRETKGNTRLHTLFNAYNSCIQRLEQTKWYSTVST